jgi:hypothetical protein
VVVFLLRDDEEEAERPSTTTTLAGSCRRRRGRHGSVRHTKERLCHIRRLAMGGRNQILEMLAPTPFKVGGFALSPQQSKGGLTMYRSQDDSLSRLVHGWHARQPRHSRAQESSLGGNLNRGFHLCLFRLL